LFSVREQDHKSSEFKNVEVIVKTGQQITLDKYNARGDM